MLEIVHDLAPGAALGFATAIPDEATFAQNILDLAAAGCNIIVDDIIYLDESPFQDGPVAQAVNTVTAAGVLYFSSAGNEGNMDDLTSGTWEGDFLASGAADPAPLAGAEPARLRRRRQLDPGGSSAAANPPLLIWAEHYDLATGIGVDRLRPLRHGRRRSPRSSTPAPTYRTASAATTSPSSSSAAARSPASAC